MIANTKWHWLIAIGILIFPDVALSQTPKTSAPAPEQNGQLLKKMGGLKPMAAVDGDAPVRKLAKERYNLSLKILAGGVALVETGGAPLMVLADDFAQLRSDLATTGADAAEKHRMLELHVELVKHLTADAGLLKESETALPRQLLTMKRLLLGLEIELLETKDAAPKAP
ncbi:hypothetical protein [Zavarzinella formosa]|uniref:hypothetical protein n=1 Tax=Zavarzinella formosa TaxID=360055 RepID=UPI0002F33054|nr:hypothetical protein [Zavarzinella formosa]